MSLPNSRASFEHNLNLLIERASQKKLFLPDDPRVKTSLLNARKSPNSRINFLTVDEITRSLANSVAQMETELLKKTSADEQ